MLLRFRVANHRSLRDEQELSLVAQPRKGEGKPTGTLPETVRVAGIYGANASGKSNVLDALRFLIDAVLDSFGKWPATGGVPRRPFLLDPAMRSRPSLYEADIVVDDVRHTYGFEVDDQRVLAEWLYSYPTGSRKRMLFERSGDDLQFGRTLGGQNSTIAKLTRPNALFLSAAAANSHRLLTRVLCSFDRVLPKVTFGEGGLERMLAAISTRHAGPVMPTNEWLRFADLGVSHVRLEIDDEATPSSSEPLDSTPYFQRGRVKFAHVASDGGVVELPFDDESAGTRIWLALTNVIFSPLSLGGTVLVDEVDSSLHPKLSAALIQMFKDPVINPKGAQLIFTSHDVSLLGNLLDDDILDRDEVWFTEKDGSGASKLFPLTDFQPRRGENFERAYLQGRYGAVPYIDIDELRKLFSERDAS